jgi:hypothetical protein
MTRGIMSLDDVQSLMEARPRAECRSTPLLVTKHMIGRLSSIKSTGQRCFFLSDPTGLTEVQHVIHSSL